MIRVRDRYNKYANRVKENKLLVIVALSALLIAFLPYLQEGLVKGSDMYFHLARIDSLKEELLNGTFPVKLHSVLCYDYGYAVGFFYPNFFLHIPAFFRIMGFSLEAAYKIFAALMFLGIFFSMYYSSWRISGDKYAALTIAVCYILSRQILNSFYHASTMGSSLGVVFMPMAITGMLEFCEKDKKPFLLGAGFLGLIYSHLLSTYISLFVCLLIMLFYYKKVILKPFKLLSLGLTAGMVLALSISYWGPMLEQLRAQTLKVSRPWTSVEDNVVSALMIFGENQGWMILIITFLVGFFIIEYGKSFRQKRLLYLTYFLCLVLSALTACKIFWIAFKPVFNTLQFPVRLFFGANILVLFSAALILGTVEIKLRQKKIVLICVFILSAYFGLTFMKVNAGEIIDFSQRVVYEEFAGIGAGEEYLPVEVKREMLTEPDMAGAADGEKVAGTKAKGVFTFVADLSKESYTVPFIWYKGYVAETEDGIRLETGKIPETSMLRVDMPKADAEGKEGNVTIRVWYEGTWFQRLCYIINAAAVLLMVVAMIGRKYWTIKPESRSKRI